MKKTLKERRRASDLDKLNWLVDESLSVKLRVTYPDTKSAILGRGKEIQLVVTHIDEPTKSFAVLAKDVPIAIMKASQMVLERWLEQ